MGVRAVRDAGDGGGGFTVALATEVCEHLVDNGCLLAGAGWWSSR